MVKWTSGRSEWTLNQSAANGKKEPIGSNVGDGSNGSYLAITHNTYYSGKTENPNIAADADQCNC